MELIKVLTTVIVFLASMGGLFAFLRKRLNNLESKVLDIQTGAIASNPAEITRLKERITTERNTNDNQDRKIDSLTDKTNKNENEIIRISGRVDSHGVMIEDFKSQLGKIDDSLSDVAKSNSSTARAMESLSLTFKAMMEGNIRVAANFDRHVKIIEKIEEMLSEKNI